MEVITTKTTYQLDTCVPYWMHECAGDHHYELHGKKVFICYYSSPNYELIVQLDCFESQFNVFDGHHSNK
jgi:hypothetical protein